MVRGGPREKEDKEMTRAKAMKHLERALEIREFWREAYVDNERDKRSILDLRHETYDEEEGFITVSYREERRRECRAEIREANERIARFQRIVM